MANAQTGHRVLVLAYACEPGKGSEQGVGWNWSLQLARFAEVVVITRANNRAAIEREMARRNATNPKFVYYDPPGWVRRLKRKERGLYAFYTLWQWGSYRFARRLAAETSFTHVIQLTFGSIWMPVFVHRLGARFVWGPIGGGEGIPAHLVSQASVPARFVQGIRRALIATIRWNPLIVPVLDRAEKIIVRTADTMTILPDKHRRKACCILETGIDEDLLERCTPPRDRAERDIPTLLYTGRLVAVKNVEVLLLAAARARDRGSQFRLRIVGDGPERRSLEETAERLGLVSVVKFVGAVSHEHVLEELRRADVYVFPSLKEGGAWSLMEAMCAALPVICLDTSGMSVITTDQCAMRISPTSREAIIEGFAEAIVALCSSGELRARLGSNARERMRKEFLWDRKGEQVGRLLFGYSAPRSDTERCAG